MIHHLASLPWPWLVLCVVAVIASGPTAAKELRRELRVYERARAYHFGACSDSAITSPQTAERESSPEQAPNTLSAAAPLPVAAEDYFDRHLGSRRA